MKLQRLDWCKGAQNLIPLIATGRLRSEFTEPFIHGTYLEAWWRCLKLSKEFTQSCRTGIFTSKAAYETFRIFGPLEDLNFKDWWITKGHEYFSGSITTLQVTLFVKKKEADLFSVSVNAFQDVSSQLAGQEFGGMSGNRTLFFRFADERMNHSTTTPHCSDWIRASTLAYRPNATITTLNKSLSDIFIVTYQNVTHN